MKPKLIFLSGWAYPATEYPAFERMLSEHFEVEIIDSTSFRQYADDVCAHIKKVNEPVWLAGWSLGSIVALKTASMIPDALKGLMLLAPTPSFCIQDDFSAGTPPVSVRAMAKGLKLTPTIVMSSFIKLAVKPAKLSKEELQNRVQHALSFDADILQEDLRFLATTDIREEVSGITTPTIIIHGQEDTIIPPEAGYWLHQHISNSIPALLSDVGHDLPVIHYETTADIMIRFQKGLA